VLWPLLLAAAGCGQRHYPVGGKVTFEDGTPLTEGMVVFETGQGEKKITARGAIQADGSYQLSTHKPGDGVPPGAYRALIAPPSPKDPENPEKSPFDERFTDFKTSGLEFTVQAGPNDIPIRVSRPAAALHPVRGRVTLDDGTPLSGGVIVFESREGKKVTARGEIRADGTFQLGTGEPGGGVPAGRYRVRLGPPEGKGAPPRAPAFDKRYADFQTSGLEVEVKAGPNEIPIQLARPGKD
jgi:hypothetical protein